MNAPLPTTTLKNVAAGEVTRRGGADNFRTMLEARRNEIARALPRHLNADTMMRIALTCFSLNPRLAECPPISVFSCVIQASQLGLRPGLMGECYLIPYKNREGVYICTLQIGYQGLLELVRRSGLVESISAHLVRTNDQFEVQWGTEPGIVHRPFLDGDAGPVRLVYAVARLKGGGSHAELMTLADIQRIKARSQNVQTASRFGKQTPWDTDWDEMARKTVLRRICKYLPKSPELASALALDDAASRGVQQLGLQDAISNSYVPPPFAAIDEDTGEIDPPPQPPAPDAPAPRQRATRPRKGGSGGAAVEEPAEREHSQQEQQTAGAEKSVRAFAECEYGIRTATSAETAALVLDQARGVLDPEELEQLAAVYKQEWGEA